MSAPAIRGTTAPVAGGSTTSPAGTQVGDLVIVVTWERNGAGSATHTLQSGFTNIWTPFAHDDGSTDGAFSCAYKVASSSGANAYQAYTSSSGTEWWTGCIVLKAGTFNEAAIAVGNPTTGTTNAAPDPPAVTLTGDTDYLAMAIAAWHLSASATVTVTPPTNYTAGFDIAGAATGELALAWRKVLGGVTTQDPGAFADDVTPNGTARATIAVPMKNPSDGVWVKKVDEAVGTATSLVLTVPTGGVAAGDLLIITGGQATNGAISSVTDSRGGNTYNVDVSRTTVNTGSTIVSCVVAVALQAGDTITVNFPANLSCAAAAHQFTPPAGKRFSATVDKTASNSSTSTTPSSGATATLSQADELCIGAISYANVAAGFEPDSGWTPLSGAQNGSGGVTDPFYKVVAATTAVTASGVVAPSLAWNAVVATYRILNAYSLDCQPGSFSVTGTAATLVRGLMVNAQPGAYTLTGTAATLARGLFINAQPGAFTETGVAAGVLRDYPLNAQPAAYTLTGTAATPLATRLIDAQPAAYTLTGTAATVVRDYPLNAQPGAYTVTGTAASLVRAITLNAQPTTYTLTGSAAGVLRDYPLNAQPGSLTIEAGTQTVKVFDMAVSGANSWFQHFTATPGEDYVFSFYAMRGDSTDVEYSVYDWSNGADVVPPTDYFADTGNGEFLRIEVTFTAPPGATDLAVYLSRDSDDAGSTFVAAAQVEVGSTATTWERTTASPGAVNLLSQSEDLDTSPWGTFGGVTMTEDGTTEIGGGETALLAARLLNLAPGSYTLTGFATTLALARMVSADPGAYTLTGPAATLTYEPLVGDTYTLDLQPGAFTVSGVAAGVLVARMVNASPGSYVLTGAAAEVRTTRLLAADPGAFVVTGAAAAVLAARLVSADAGAFAIVGFDGTLLPARVLALDAGAFLVTGADATMLGGFFALPVHTDRTRSGVRSGRTSRGNGNGRTSHTGSTTRTST